MKRFLLRISAPFFLCLLLVAATSLPASAQVGTILFSVEVDEEWYPINPDTVFDTNVLNFVFEREEAFGVPYFVFSAYAVLASGEELLHREEIGIDPEWNFFLLREVVFPDVGMYKIVFSDPNFTELAVGYVEIRQEVEPMDEMPEKQPEESIQGKILKELFNKYKPEG